LLIVILYLRWGFETFRQFGFLGLPAENLSGDSSFRDVRDNPGWEYLSANGHPVYKMKKKYPLGYTG
jgi:hypothetical protein